jgi:hypothetical protein
MEAGFPRAIRHLLSAPATRSTATGSAEITASCTAYGIHHLFRDGLQHARDDRPGDRDEGTNLVRNRIACRPSLISMAARAAGLP